MSKRRLRDCILVIHGLSLRGGTHYFYNDEVTTMDGSTEVKEYKGKRIIEDLEEYDTAVTLRSKLERWLTMHPDAERVPRSEREPYRICTKTALGMVCPADKEHMLDEVIDEIKAEVEFFNEDATTCRLFFTPVKFEVSPDHEAAAKAIGAKIMEVLNDLKYALHLRDFQSIRDHLQKTKGLDTIWPDSTNAVLSGAFEDLREQAKAISKELRDAEYQLRATDIRVNFSKVDLARTAFIDVDEELTFEETLPKTALRAVEAA